MTTDDIIFLSFLAVLYFAVNGVSFMAAKDEGLFVIPGTRKQMRQNFAKGLLLSVLGSFYILYLLSLLVWAPIGRYIQKYKSLPEE